MYAHGMTERAIHDYLSTMYGLKVSADQINNVINEVTREVMI